MFRERKKHQDELEQIETLLRLEDVAGATRRLSKVFTEKLEPRLRFRFEVLRARVYLLERNFGLVKKGVLKLRELAGNSAELSEAMILDAYGKALAGHSRSALRIVVPILREAGQFEESRARSAYVAGLCLFRRGHYKWARASFWQAMAYYRLVSEPIETSRMLNSLALLEKSAGNLSLALEYFDESVKLLPAGACQRHRRRLLTNRGLCLLKLGRIQEARLCLSEAWALAVVAKDLFVDVSINNNLGHTYRMEGNFKAAESCYMKALESARESSSRRQECLALEFAGELYLEMGQLGEALDYLGRAHEIALDLSPHGDLMMEILRRRGELQVAMGKTKEGKEDLARAIRLCRSRGETRERLLAERALILLEETEAAALQIRLSPLLEEIRNLGDRFEYLRTVDQALSRFGEDLGSARWFKSSIVTATHYADSLGLDYWKDRLSRAVGYSREVMSRGRNSGEECDEFFMKAESREFRRCLEAARLASRSDSPVLISGETGVGKEVIARLVHEQSARSDGPLVAINCGALPDGLVESELFGHARGTFTGAHRDKDGLFEVAKEGSVFLDEVGELPPQAQVKLLRFLDSGEFRRVGETKVRKANVRVLAATNRDLSALVESGAFRKDLLFRLNVFQVEVPPLRTRREDIVPLAQFFLKKNGGASTEPSLSLAVRSALENHDWPGNVRELKNLCDYLAARAWGRSEIVLDDVASRVKQPSESGDAALSSFERERLALERDQIAEALEKCGGKVMHAAKLLRMSRNTLSQRMKELGIARESFRARS